MLYSIGYEGRTIKQFVETLQLAGVDVLVDVRLTAVSRKPGFSKTRLSESLAVAGIDYVHERLLGNPKDNRDAFRGDDLEAGRRRFAKVLSNGSSDALDRLVVRACDAKVAVLCVERDSSRCHRQVITEAAQDLRPSLIVVDL
ncbi:MAG: DUF488 family protein [Egibacteraceae bacterium]